MRAKELIVSCLIFYLLALLQTSFFTYFNILGQTPNLILVFLFFLIFREKKHLTFILLNTCMAGFFLDIFSNRHMGISILVLSAEVIFLENLLKNIRRENILVFILFFVLFALIYEQALVLFDYFMIRSRGFILDRFILLRTLYGSMVIILCLALKSLKISKARE